jgi:TolB-like protein
MENAVPRILACIFSLVVIAAAVSPGAVSGKPLVGQGANQKDVEPHILAGEPGTNELEDFIFSKMKFDHYYFKRIVQVKERGGTYQNLTPDDLEKEVKRAHVYIPFLDEFAKELDDYKAGKPFQLPPGDPVFRVYANLTAILDLFQAFDRKNFRAAVDYGNRVVIDRRQDLGLFRGSAAEYYVALYRHFFYLMSVSHYNLGEQDAAVAWLARTTADADLQAIKEQLANRPQQKIDKRAEHLMELKNRPLAIAELGNLAKNPADDWIGPAVAEVLTADLSRYSDFFIVERRQIDAVLSEVRLSQLGVTNENEAAQVGKMLSAGSILSGSYRSQGTVVSIQLRVFDADAGQVLGTAEGDVSISELVPGVRKLATVMLGNMGWLDSVVEGQLSIAHAPRSETLRDLIQARLMMSTNAEEAKRLYAHAVRDDPAYANLFVELKNRFAGLAATVGILPFVNLSGNDADRWMAQGVAEALATDLPKMNFTVVERTQLAEVLKTESVGQIIGTDNAQEIGRKAGADFVVLGSILYQEPVIRIDARFVDVKSGVVATSCSIENRTGNFMKALATLSAELAQTFNEPLAKEAADKLLGNTMSADDFERLIRQEHAKASLPRSARPAAVETRAFDAAVEFGGYLLTGMGQETRSTLMERIEVTRRFLRAMRAGAWGILYTPTGPIETSNNAGWQSSSIFTGGFAAGLDAAYSPIFVPNRCDAAIEAGIGLYQPYLTIENPTSPSSGTYPQHGCRPYFGGSIGVMFDYYVFNFLSVGLAFRTHLVDGYVFQVGDKSLYRNASGLSTTIRVTARL